MKHGSSDAALPIGLLPSFRPLLSFCMHIPVTSWAHGPPHCLVIIPARQVLSGSGFERFIPILVNPEEGRATVDAEWL
jgi:hypothetical protein